MSDKTSVTLTSAEGCKVSGKQKPVGLFFPHSSQLSRVTLDLVLEKVKLNILTFFESERFFSIKRNNCCFTDYVNKIFSAGVC